MKDGIQGYGPGGTLFYLPLLYLLPGAREPGPLRGGIVPARRFSARATRAAARDLAR